MPSHGPPPDAFADVGARLAARGRAIADEATSVLADAFAAVLADAGELAALHPASARDAVDFLVRVGRMTRDEADAIVRRAGSAMTDGGPDGAR